jgi:S-DNA-T family DNA segregation ATPase FtsK/SpoIIIE
LATAPRKKKGSRKKSARAAAEQLPSLPLSEIVAVIIGTVGILLCLALVSYHPGDPSWNVEPGSGAAGGGTANWMGPVGAWLADLLVSAFGVPSLVVPVALLFFSLSLFRNKTLDWPFLRIMASMCLTVFACLLLAFYPGKFTFRGGMVQAGGAFGQVVVQVLEQQFNSPGTLVIILAGLVLSLQFTLALEIGPPLLKVLHYVQAFFHGLLKLTGGAVVVGAGAAANGASSLGQRLKEGASSWREEAARRREAAEEEAAERAEQEAREAKGRPTKKGRKAEEGLEPARRTKVNALKDGGPELEPESDDDPFAPPKKARGERSSELERVDDAPDFVDEGAPDDELLDDEDGMAPGRAASAGDPDRRPRQRGLPFEPKIVKSKYMEEPVRLSDDAFSQPANDADFMLPPMHILKSPPHQEGALSEEELLASARLLEEKLRDYGVEGRVVEIHPGPVITMYEYAPAPGVKVSKITNLSNDLALALKATAVRIVAPLPGKAAVGIEVPNRARQTVFLREVVEHEEFRREVLKLPMAIGKDIEGRPYAADMARMPHLLVAGSTGAGKSVAVNAMLISLLYARKPEEVRFILVDPKMIEFSVYNDIPHLLMPVVTDPKKAAAALNWGVDEMTRRYQLLTLAGARNIASYNSLMEEKLKTWDEAANEGIAPPRKLPYIVIVIDELADLMMVAGKEVQESIVRLAQMARAAGIHMILATQRPSVDVITGLIKANFPARIAFKVSSKTDSRTILDANGAEYLLGNGDMLFLPPGTASLLRLHGAFVSDDEARQVVEHLRKQGQPRYEESLLASTADDFGGSDPREEEDYDEFYEEAKQIVLETGQASISTIQRRLKIGYNRSARMVERMCKEGLIGPPTQGGKPREIYASKLQASLR